MTEVGCCPTCGQAVVEPLAGVRWDSTNRVVLTNVGGAILTRTEAMVFEAMWRRRPSEYTDARALANAVWADDPNGGPEHASNIGTQVCKLRKKLEAIGLTIPRGVKGTVRFQLVDLDKKRKGIAP